MLQFIVFKKEGVLYIIHTGEPANIFKDDVPNFIYALFGWGNNTTRHYKDLINTGEAILLMGIRQSLVQIKTKFIQL